MQISWDDAQTFLAVSEQRSFSRAARLLGVGQPTVSRRIANLEARMGTQLFLRGRQGAEPTEVALKLIPAAEQMARWATEFSHSAQAQDASISGRVRIAAPPGLAVEQLAPFAAVVKARYPEVLLEVISGIEHLDLTRGAADLALRTRPPNEPELITLMKIRNSIGIYATSSYVESLPSPCTWTDIAWITWSAPFESVAPRPMLERLIANFMPVFASDDYLVQKSALRAGLGAMIIGTPEASEREEHLVQIDLGINLPDNEFYLVCAKSTQMVPRIRAIARLLSGHIETVYSGAAS
jgi:DNA-binding transcriptional LysR family regulator